MFIIVVFSLFHSYGYAQQKGKNIIKGKNISIDGELNWLLIYKMQYEQYSLAAKAKNEFTEKNVRKRDSVYTLYVEQVENIRNSPEKYLTHINRSIKNGKVEYDGIHRVPYDYVNTALPFDMALHSVTRLELYEIVKKYIFEKKYKLLPHRTDAYIKAGGVEKMPMPLNME